MLCVTATCSPVLQASVSGTLSNVGRILTEWETLVIFGVNVSELDITVNMSNVMGHTV